MSPEDVDPKSFWAARKSERKANFVREMQEYAHRIATDEARALDEAVAALIRAGAPVDRIEIVVEQCAEGPGIIRRSYARVRPG